MKTKIKFLIYSLLISSSLFSGGDDEIRRKEELNNQINKILIENQLDKCDLEFLKSFIDKVRITKEEINKYYDKETRKEIRKVAEYFDIPSEWMYRLFYKECRLNPYATNRLSNAQGIIQFLPSTANNLGTSVEKLSKMTVKEQLPFVKKYLEKINPNRRFNNFPDLYMAVFFPRAINESNTYVIGSHKGDNYVRKVAKQNKGIDKNKDNSITVKEFAAYANSC